MDGIVASRARLSRSICWSVHWREASVSSVMAKVFCPADDASARHAVLCEWRSSGDEPRSIPFAGTNSADCCRRGSCQRAIPIAGSGRCPAAQWSGASRGRRTRSGELEEETGLGATIGSGPGSVFGVVHRSRVDSRRSRPRHRDRRRHDGCDRAGPDPVRRWNHRRSSVVEIQEVQNLPHVELPEFVLSII